MYLGTGSTWYIQSCWYMWSIDSFNGEISMLHVGTGSFKCSRWHQGALEIYIQSPNQHLKLSGIIFLYRSVNIKFIEMKAKRPLELSIQMLYRWIREPCFDDFEVDEKMPSELPISAGCVLTGSPCKDRKDPVRSHTYPGIIELTGSRRFMSCPRLWRVYEWFAIRLLLNIEECRWASKLLTTTWYMIGRRNHVVKPVACRWVGSHRIEEGKDGTWTRAYGAWTPSCLLIHSRTMRRNPRKRGRNRLRFSQRTLPALHSEQANRIPRSIELAIVESSESSRKKTTANFEWVKQPVLELKGSFGELL